MTLEQLVPGARDLLFKVALIVAAVCLVLLAGSCWVYHHHAASDDALRTELKASQSALGDAKHVRDSVTATVAMLDRYAQAQHEIAVQAIQRADSLLGVAERHRTRVRVIDSTHVSVTASDSQRVAEVREVPIQVTEQLAADSAAEMSLDDALAQRKSELAVQLTESRALRNLVATDSLVIQQLERDKQLLTSAKLPRFTFNEGIVLGTGLAILVKVLVATLLR